MLKSSRVPTVELTMGIYVYFISGFYCSRGRGFWEFRSPVAWGLRGLVLAFLEKVYEASGCTGLGGFQAPLGS